MSKIIGKTVRPSPTHQTICFTPTQIPTHSNLSIPLLQNIYPCRAFWVSRGGQTGPPPPKGHGKSWLPAADNFARRGKSFRKNKKKEKKPTRAWIRAALNLDPATAVDWIRRSSNPPHRRRERKGWGGRHAHWICAAVDWVGGRRRPAVDPPRRCSPPCAEEHPSPAARHRRRRSARVRV